MSEPEWGEHQAIVEEAKKAAEDTARELWYSNGYKHLSGSYYDVEIGDVDIDDEDGHTVEGNIIIGLDEEGHSELHAYEFKYHEHDKEVELV